MTRNASGQLLRITQRFDPRKRAAPVMPVAEAALTTKPRGVGSMAVGHLIRILRVVCAWKCRKCGESNSDGQYECGYCGTRR